VGPNGGGKSTLVNLICRFYDPTAGRVTIDGVPLPDLALADLRGRIAMVTQQTELFNESIHYNIKYGRWDATDEEIEEAARKAHAHDFIADFPDGYGTMVGPGGFRLSGGERQRISLARAFLKDAPILVLDEPTSSVDAVTECRIMEAMERLMAGRTTFLIAHRLATLQHCDLRVEVADGRVMVGG